MSGLFAQYTRPFHHPPGATPLEQALIFTIFFLLALGAARVAWFGLRWCWDWAWQATHATGTNPKGPYQHDERKGSLAE
jgi:hypothetical protein